MCPAWPGFFPRNNSTISHRSQFNIIHPDSGNKIDVMVQGTDDWSRIQLSRRQLMAFEPEFEVYIAAPEDIILGKLLYYKEGGSEKHLRDIAGMLKLRGGQLDKAYLTEWAGKLQVEQEWGVGQTWRR